jgi:hypothetical protein
MTPKTKHVETTKNPFLPPSIDLERVPLADKDYKVTEPKYEFNFFELHFWIKDIFLDQSDEIGFWESNFPLYFLLHNILYLFIYFYMHIMLVIMCNLKQLGKYQVKDMNVYIDPLIDELLKLWATSLCMTFVNQ